MHKIIIKTASIAFFILCASNSFAQTLENAVSHALLTNPGMLFNQVGNLSSYQGVKEAQGALYPLIQLNAGIGREHSNSPTTASIDGAEDGLTLTRKESGITLIQPIFAGWGLVSDVKRSRYQLQSQEYRTLSVANSLSFDVVKKYLSVLKRQQLLILAKQNLAKHQKIVGIIKERTTAGVGKNADLEQALSRESLALSTLVGAENRLSNARTSFTKVVGEQPRDLTWPKYPRSKELPLNLSEAINLGLTQNPSLKASNAFVLQSREAYKVTKSQNWPRLDAVLSSSRNKNLDGLEGANDDDLAMLRVSYDLSRGGAITALQRKSAYQIQQAIETRNGVWLNIKEQIIIAWHGWISAGHHVKYLSDYKKFSYNTNQAYNEQFKVGKRTLLDLLDSQNEYYKAEVDYLIANYAEILARYQILNKSGVIVGFLNLNKKHGDVTNQYQHVWVSNT